MIFRLHRAAAPLRSGFLHPLGRWLARGLPALTLGAFGLAPGLAARAAAAPAPGDWAGPNPAATTPAEPPRPSARLHTLVIFGDSLAAGYGLDDPATESFPGVLEQRIAAARLPWRVVNAGESGETTAGGLRRVAWILRQPVDVFVLELGGNDGLRGTAPAVTRANLQAIIDEVRAEAPAARIILAGMQMPTSMGEDYTRAFAAVYPSLATANRLPLIPALLEGVGGRPELNQADGIHPTAAGARRVADNVWAILRPLLADPPPPRASP
jgi:acyl-CoA thioesterase-1